MRVFGSEQSIASIGDNSTARPSRKQQAFDLGAASRKKLVPIRAIAAQQCHGTLVTTLSIISAAAVFVFLSMLASGGERGELHSLSPAEEADLTRSGPALNRSTSAVFEKNPDEQSSEILMEYIQTLVAFR